MSLLYSLRRSVALFICPEMGVEARLKAARVSCDTFEAAITRVTAATAPFGAVVEIIKDRRLANAVAGGNDEVFLGLVAAQTAMITLPVGGGRK